MHVHHHRLCNVDVTAINRSQPGESPVHEQPKDEPMTISTVNVFDLPQFAPVPPSAPGPAVNEHGYFVGQIERNLYWVTDGTYQSAFLTTSDGVVLFDDPPPIGNNIKRAVDVVAAANAKRRVLLHQNYMADISESSRKAIDAVDPRRYYTHYGVNKWPRPRATSTKPPASPWHQ